MGTTIKEKKNHFDLFKEDKTKFNGEKAIDQIWVCYKEELSKNYNGPGKVVTFSSFHKNKDELDISVQGHCHRSLH